MKKIFAIAGKACAGKDSLVKEIKRRIELPMALSFTTRPKRDGETEGVEYNFITDDDFWDLYGYNMLAEYTSYEVANGETWHYGLTREELEKDDFVLVIVNPEGVEQLRKLYGERLVVIYITADDKVRLKRYLDRDNTNNVAECCRRYLADEKDFENFVYDYKLINHDFELALDKLERFIRNECGKEIHKEVQREFEKNPFKFIGDTNA